LSGKAECTACGLTFASDTSFDRHRVGRYIDTGSEARRCLRLEEMLRGEPVIRRQDGTVDPTPWRQNTHGHWTHNPERPEMPIPELTVDSGSIEGARVASGVTAARMDVWDDLRPQSRSVRAR
jgi:hypothetical protein